MATKKEMVATLVGRGYDEKDIKDLKNTELEAMLAESEIVEDTQEVTEEVITDEVISEESAPEQSSEEVSEDSTETAEEVLSEYTHQVRIFTEFIYNKKHRGADLIVTNMGYGDLYVRADESAKVGAVEDRILFKESRRFEGADRVSVISASQPVVQVLEVK